MIPATQGGGTPQEFILRTLAELMRDEEEARLSVGLMLPNNPAWVSAHALFKHVGGVKFSMYCDFMALLQGLAIEERIFLDDDPEHMETLARVRNVGEPDFQLCARQFS
jgi:hypothetical protein